MKGSVAVVLFVVAVVAAVAIAWGTVPLVAWWFHRGGQWDVEIAWIEGAQSVLPLGDRLDPLLDVRHRERIERELRAGRLDRAVHGMRAARRRMLRPGAARDPKLVELGLETYARAADRMARHGRLSAAADWNDTLFVFAVRDPDEEVRRQATAAFLEGLDLRVQDREPCAALARLRWAEQGLGGEIPGIWPGVGEELEARCAAARGARRR